MPLKITIPARELYDPKANRFITIKETTIQLEHSLISISKWESKWHKSFFSKEQKTDEESVDYIRCMCLTQNIDPNVFYGITQEDGKRITDYISDPMTATTFNHQDKKRSREVITSELIYFYMVDFGIPFDPCQKWHFNRLMTLIEVCSVKNQPSKKMKQKDWLPQRNALNKARRSKAGHHG